MIGTRIEGFEIRERLGAGGMGVVYSAWDPELHRLVALKALPESARGDPVSWRRFRREAEVAASLSHPSICQIHRFLEDADPPSLILELIPGPTLSTRIAQGPMPIRETVTMVRRIAEGLAEAHNHSIVHRDIKPANILLTLDGRPKLTDFGLAVLVEATRITMMRTPLGTVAYMSPEHVSGEDPIPQMDVWSLGVVMFEMLTGRRPFRGTIPEQVFVEIKNRDVPLVSDLRPEIPDAVAAIVQRALMRDPADRYPDGAAMAADLQRVEQALASETIPIGGLPRTQVGSWRMRIAWLSSALALMAAIVLAIRFWPGGRALPDITVHRVTASAWWEGEPSLSPDGERIAYTASSDGNVDIYISAASGGRPFRLTENAADDSAPTWLPGGADLLFVSNRSGESSIWRIGQYGGDAMMLLSGGFSPAVSPDGEWLAFVTLDEHGASRIGVAPLDEPENFRIITSADDGLMLHSDPAWAPDSRKICYSAYDGLWVIDRTGVGATRIVADDDFSSDPVWSPDGRHIYYSSMDRQTIRIRRVEANGKHALDVTQGTGPERHPTLSGSSSRLVYSTYRNDSDLVVRHLESGREYYVSSVASDYMGTIARDGSALVFVSDRWGGTSDLWTQELANGQPVGEPRMLFDSPLRCSMPEISPDSKRVAFYVIDGDTRPLMMVAMNGSRAIALTDGQHNDSQPHWSPDGNRIVFVSEDRGGGYGLWQLEVDDHGPVGVPQRIDTEDIHLWLPRWSPSGRMIAGVANVGDGLDIWVCDLEGGMQRITRDALVQRVRWGADDDEIWAVGNWGSGAPTVRIIDVATGEDRPANPEVVFAPTNDDPSIDLAPSAGILVYTAVTSGGDLWMLEARNGGF